MTRPHEPVNAVDESGGGRAALTADGIGAMFASTVAHVPTDTGRTLM